MLAGCGCSGAILLVEGPSQAVFGVHIWSAGKHDKHDAAASFWLIVVGPEHVSSGCSCTGIDLSVAQDALIVCINQQRRTHQAIKTQRSGQF